MNKEKLLRVAQKIANGMKQLGVDGDVSINQGEIVIQCADADEERIYVDVIEGICSGNAELGTISDIDIIMASYFWYSDTAEGVPADEVALAE